MRARSGQTTEATTDAHLEVDLGLLEQFEVLAEAAVREPRGYRSVVCHFRSTAVDKGARGGAPFGEVLVRLSAHLAARRAGQSRAKLQLATRRVRIRTVFPAVWSVPRLWPHRASGSLSRAPLFATVSADILLEFAKLLLCPCSCHVRRLA
jgi:hypothetical protein